MGSVVCKARQKLQGGGEDVLDQLDLDCPGHDHVGVGDDIDLHPEHPLPKGITNCSIQQSNTE